LQLLIVNFAVAQNVQDVRGVDVGLQVSSPCVENEVCDSGAGETQANCPDDCGCNNNNSCEVLRGETEFNCVNDCYTAQPISPGGGGPIISLGPFRIINIIVNQITDQSAKISWTIESQIQATCKVFLGATENYEKEVIAGNVFSKFHSTEIVGLSPQTTYHFKIECLNRNFNEIKTTDQQFTTLPFFDDESPANVSNFQITNYDKRLKLIWQNPIDSDFKEVKIFKSEKFYPQEPQEGALVYAGNGNEVEDLNLTNGKAYYYIAFAYDLAGNRSSGALTFGVPGVGEKPGKPPIEPPVGPAPPEVEKITLKNFDFQQGGKKIFPTDDNIIILESLEPLKISIDYEKVPEVLKTIMLTLQKGDKYFSFLLRINEDKTKYLATIAPPASGIYPLSIYVLDYKEQALKKIDSMLKISGNVMGQEKTFSLVMGIISKYWPNLLFLILTIIAVFVAIEIYRKRQPDNYYKQKIR